jgi:hypothetical protein
MFDSASSLATNVQPDTGVPTARKVIFEIGAILAAHLALALAVTVVLRLFGQF